MITEILNKPRCAFLLGIFLSLVTFVSCEDERQTSPQSAFIGGKILNPTTAQVVLKHKGQIIDTIALDENNRFSYTLDSVVFGLYTIQHRPETQNLYIQPGDSLLMRANTLAFDESLHFSGKGDDRNNFMANMFLLDESNSDLLLSVHKMNPKEFARVTDSIKEVRLQSLETAADKKEFSEDFVHLAEQIIAYENHDLRERYTYLIKKYYKQFSKEIPEDFHQYRSEIDFNIDALQCSPTYKRFIENYLINFSLDWCAESSLDSEDCYDLTNHQNIKARIEKASEILHLPQLRTHFFTELGVMGIIMSTSREEIIQILRLLKDKEYPEEELENLRQLGALQLAYLPGTQLNEAPLITAEGEKIKMGSVINDPSIVFLWSIYSDDHQEEHRIVRELRKKYPEVDFIGINLDIGKTEEWQMALEKYEYSLQHEYQLDSTRIQRRFFEYYYDKLLFINSSGEVVKGDVFITSPEFESHILEFLNRN